MKELLIALITLMVGFFLGQYQEKRVSQRKSRELKNKLFRLIQDLEYRRQKDLESVNSAFSNLLLRERRLLKNNENVSVHLPRRIEVEAIKDTFEQVAVELPLGCREGIRVLIEAATELNIRLQATQSIPPQQLSSNDLLGVHCQIFPYGYIVHQLSELRERYVLPKTPLQELIESSSKAFGFFFHPDEIIEDYLSRTKN